MPRLIDPDTRRHDIARATWRLVLREGLDAVSVRNVAREAGLSTGSVRHSFSTQAELLTYAMAASGERLSERLAALDPGAAPLDAAAAVLAELLPLDEERRREAEVWLAFVARARVEPELREIGERADETLRAIVRHALEPLALADAELAAEHTHALVDGLAMHAVLRPGRPAPELMRRVLRAHVERLAAS